MQCDILMIMYLYGIWVIVYACIKVRLRDCPVNCVLYFLHFCLTYAIRISPLDYKISVCASTGRSQHAVGTVGASVRVPLPRDVVPPAPLGSRLEICLNEAVARFSPRRSS